MDIFEGEGVTTRNNQCNWKCPESAKLRQATILNFVGNHISRRNYFCQIAKFGEDILNHGRVDYFSKELDLFCWCT